MIGIYVHDTAKEPYAMQIINGTKTIETRTRDVLGRFVGQRVLIIRTRSGKPTDVVGCVVISAKHFRTKDELELLRDETCIHVGSKFDCAGRGKWCYTLESPEIFLYPVPLTCFRVVKHTMSYAELELKEE